MRVEKLTFTDRKLKKFFKAFLCTVVHYIFKGKSEMNIKTKSTFC